MRTDLKRALELEREICAFEDGVMLPYISQKHYSNFAVDKFAAMVGGWCGITSRVRFPYRSIPAEDAYALRARLGELLPGFLAL